MASGIDLTISNCWSGAKTAYINPTVDGNSVILEAFMMYVRLPLASRLFERHLEESIRSDLIEQQWLQHG